MKDIESIEDIKVLVDNFYTKIQADEMLAPIFLSKIEDWQPHLEKMYLFWNAALFGVKGYVGNPFLSHANLKVSIAHFEQWIRLFFSTVDEHFSGTVAMDAKYRAELMASNFARRLVK